MSRTDFNQIVAESVREAVAFSLGRSMSEAFDRHVQAYLGLSYDEMPLHLGELFASLRESFGLAGDELCKLIVKKMYAKAEVPFYAIAGQPMIHYVEELKQKLANTNPP